MFQYQSQNGGLRNSVLAELCRRTPEKSSNFPAMAAELRDTLNLLSANSYNQNAAGWRKPDRSTASKKMKSGESGFDAFKASPVPRLDLYKNENRQAFYIAGTDVFSAGHKKPVL